MACMNVCSRLMVSKGAYREGLKRCSKCEVYMRVDGYRCPCCNGSLRTGPVAKSTPVLVS